MKNKTLTAKQLLYVELICNTPETLEEQQIIHELKIRKATLTRWKTDEKIKEEIQKRVRNKTDERMPHVWTSLINKAEAGDVRAIKLLFQVRGEFIEKSKEEIIVPPVVKLTIKSK